MFLNATPEVPIIVCACDDNYAMPLTVMLKSLTAHLNKYDQVIVYILGNNIQESSRSLLQESLNPSRITVKWIAVDAGKFKDLRTSFYQTPTVYNRLLIPQLLPEAVEKVIYLDCDLIVLEDIGKLWETNVDNACLAAVPEMYPGATHVSSPLGVQLYRELNIPPANKYFNSGVMVINVAKWKEENIAERVMQCVRQYEKYMFLHDQEGLNAVLHDRWEELDPRWNVESVVYGCDGESGKALPCDELAASARVIHFTGERKPWHTNCSHPKRRIFLDYLGTTVWSRCYVPRPYECNKLIRFARWRLLSFRLKAAISAYRINRFVSCMFSGQSRAVDEGLGRFPRS